MKNIRIFFEKNDRAKYISHLDMTRLFQRAVRRSEITMWYTEGFHPHLYMSFALPLSLGIESKCESVDMKLVDDISFAEVKEKLNAALPHDIVVSRVSEPLMKADEIISSKYIVKLKDFADKKQDFDLFISQNEISAVKKGKAGERTVNIKELVYGCETETDKNDLYLILTLASGNKLTLNPNLLVDEFAKSIGVSELHRDICRINVFAENGREFN